jgi:hypothetical protein
MLYILFSDGRATGAGTPDDLRSEFGADTFESLRRNRGAMQSRNDWKDFATVERIAAELNMAQENKPQDERKHYVATDSSANVSPRYDVIEAPKVGDAVSYSFNGDTYPCGHVTHISDSYRVITTTGDGTPPKRMKFYRRRLSGSWVNNGTWSLVSGHIYEQNPSF